MTLCRWLVWGSFGLGLMGAGCKNNTAEQQSAAPPGAVAATPVADTAEAPKTDPECVGPIVTGTPTTLTAGKTTWELNGSTLSAKTPPAGDTIVIGAVSDIKEDSEENKVNLRQFAAFFLKNKADLILVAGDTGENAAQVEGALSILADTKLPVLAIIGNREGKKAFAAALVSLRTKYPNVFNLNLVRHVVTPALEVISMPGYFNSRYIHAQDGCAYGPNDLESVRTLARGARAPTLLISHGGPKQDGPLALDRTSEGANVGDPALAAVLAEAKIPFGVFGNIHEAGGHATDLSGKELIKPGTSVSSLYLHPGAADAVRWGMNDKTESVGMAALVTVKAGKAKYEIVRALDPEKGKGKNAKKKGRK